MRILLIAHGNDPVPPVGWGAVEQVIWQYYLRIQRRGIPVRILNVKHPWSTLFAALLVIAKRYDVVHCHAEKPVRFLAWLNRYFNFLLVSTTHNPLNPENLTKSELKALNRCFYSPFHLVLRDDIKQLITDRNPVAVCATLPNAVETEEFSLSPKGNGKAICVGRLQSRKRQIETAEVLCREGIECDFAGPDRGEIKLTEALQKGYLGEWSRENLHQKLSEYSCLVLMSDSEGQPLVVVEALAAGIPVVVSNACTGNLDLNQPFIFVANSFEELPGLVTQAIQLRDTLSPDIRAYALAQFDYEAMVSRYITQLQQWQATAK